MLDNSNIAISIKTQEEKGVLKEITNIILSHDINISYTHLFIGKDNIGVINLELNNVNSIELLLSEIKLLDSVRSINVHSSLNEIYGKRIIIIGGGAQVSQVAMGAISESDRHNIRGERISIDTIPLVGEEEISEAVNAISRLPRASALVLAGSLMGGKISEEVSKIKADLDLVVIGLNMPGGITNYVDFVVTDPLQAGVMAVMSVADTAVLDFKKLKNKKF
ncbi:MAG: DUF5612 domain-containing protein [Methanobacteriaceae archaeon]